MILCLIVTTIAILLFPPTAAQYVNELTRDDLLAAYDVNPLIQSDYTGSGVTVAIVNTGIDSMFNSDLKMFDAQNGLRDPNVTIVKLSVSGTNVETGPSETTADAELVHSMAPDAKSLLVLVGNQTVDNGFTYIIEHNAADIATTSVFQPYWNPSSALNYVQFYNNEYAKSVRENITLITISMDWGSNNTVPFPRCPATPFCTNQTDFWTNHLPHSYLSPIYSQYVTVVGGTELKLQAGMETGWNRSGGGPSNAFTQPNWQKGTGVPANQHRDIPDIAFDASCATRYVIVWNGSQYTFCGTSAAAPIFAGIIADIAQAAGKRLGFLNPTLYSLAASDPTVFHDITSGCSVNKPNASESIITTGYCAHTGWDFVTGWGSIDALRLAIHLAPLAQFTTTSTTITPSLSILGKATPLILGTILILLAIIAARIVIRRRSYRRRPRRTKRKSVTRFLNPEM